MEIYAVYYPLEFVYIVLNCYRIANHPDRNLVNLIAAKLRWRIPLWNLLSQQIQRLFSAIIRVGVYSIFLVSP